MKLETGGHSCCILFSDKHRMELGLYNPSPYYYFDCNSAIHSVIYSFNSPSASHLQSFNQSIQPASQPASSPSVLLSVHPSVCQSVSQSVSQSINQSINQSIISKFTRLILTYLYHMYQAWFTLVTMPDAQTIRT